MKLELNRFGTPSITLTHETDAERHYLAAAARSLDDAGADVTVHHPHYAPYHGEFAGFTVPLKSK